MNTEQNSKNIFMESFRNRKQLCKNPVPKSEAFSDTNILEIEISSSKLQQRHEDVNNLKKDFDI